MLLLKDLRKNILLFCTLEFVFLNVVNIFHHLIVWNIYLFNVYNVLVIHRFWRKWFQTVTRRTSAVILGQLPFRQTPLSVWQPWWWGLKYKYLVRLHQGKYCNIASFCWEATTVMKWILRMILTFNYYYVL